MWWWTLAALADPSAVPAIRARWSAVQEAREALVPLVIDGNPTNREWAAVGEFQPSVTCYRELPPDEPYPANVVALVEVSLHVSTQLYRRTYLYSAAGELLFAHSADVEQPEWRVYWTGEAVARVQKDAEVLSAEAAGKVPAILSKRGRALQELCVAAIQGGERVPELRER